MTLLIHHWIFNTALNTEDDADVTLMILSMFTVAKAILEVLTVLQELQVIRSALLLLRLELQQ